MQYYVGKKLLCSVLKCIEMKKSKCPCRFFILKKRQKKEEANGGNLKVILTDKPMSHSDGGANPDETEE